MKFIPFLIKNHDHALFLCLSSWFYQGVKSSLYDMRYYQIKLRDLGVFFVITAFYLMLSVDLNLSLALGVMCMSYGLYALKYMGMGDMFLLWMIGVWIPGLFELSIFMTLSGAFGILLSMLTGASVIPFVPALVNALWITKLIGFIYGGAG